MLSRLRHFSEGLCRYDHCCLPLPWFAWYQHDDPVARLRRRILEMKYGRPLADVGLLTKTAAAILHLIRVGRELGLRWHRQSAACQIGFGIPRWRQLMTLCATTFRHNIPPADYYHARLFRVPRTQWNAIFTHEEVMTLLFLLEQRTEHHRPWAKSRWESFCLEHNFTRVPTLAQVIDNQLTVWDAPALQAGRDMFLKPDRDWGSHGTTLLEWLPAKHGWLASGTFDEFVPQAELGNFLIKAAAGANAILQPRLRTHPSLVDLAVRALINFRVITVCSSSGEVSLVSATLRVPPGSEHSSDVPGTGLYIPVNLTTGVLGCAESPLLHFGAMRTHPMTGAIIAGRVIQQWPEIQASAIAAHAKLPDIPTVGWDVVPTDQGVLILEANAVWSTNVAQQRGLAPLGKTGWPAVMLAYLDASGISGQAISSRPPGVIAGILSLATLAHHI
jgi:hypothetical protein